MLTSELVESSPASEVGAASAEEVPMALAYITDARFFKLRQAIKASSHKYGFVNLLRS